MRTSSGAAPQSGMTTWRSSPLEPVTAVVLVVSGEVVDLVDGFLAHEIDDLTDDADLVGCRSAVWQDHLARVAVGAGDSRGDGRGRGGGGRRRVGARGRAGAEDKQRRRCEGEEPLHGAA